MIDQDRLARVNAMPLRAMKHASFEDGACLMEAVAWVAGEPWSDKPRCACPVIGDFLRHFNDGLPDDRRTELLRPLVPLLVGSRSSDAVEMKRRQMIRLWIIDTHIVTWVRLAGLEWCADAILGEKTYLVHSVMHNACLELERKIPVSTNFFRIEATRAVRESGGGFLSGPWSISAKPACWSAAWLAYQANCRPDEGSFEERTRDTIETLQRSALAMIHEALAIRDDAH